MRGEEAAAVAPPARPSLGQVEEDEDEDNQKCESCGCGDDEDRSLLCDGCDKCYHIYCLPRPLLEVPEGAWFCQACSDAAAEAQGVAFRVGQEAKCLDSMGLRQCMVLVDSIQADSVLVHFQGGVQPNEWVPLAASRLTPPAEDDEKSAWEDDDHCQLCGSSGNSAQLLLCDSEGCGAAFHTTCLCDPLDEVPEGEWFCERCTERKLVGGELSLARALLPDTAARWRQRVLRARSSATLATVLLQVRIPGAPRANPNPNPNPNPNSNPKP